MAAAVRGRRRLDACDGAGGALAPYPGLVSLGTNDTGRILVDLEVAHGLIAVRGPRRLVQAALAALAVELVTNRWSDQMRVTLVGFGDGLDDDRAGAGDRVATLDEALPDLEGRAAELEGRWPRRASTPCSPGGRGPPTRRPGRRTT